MGRALARAELVQALTRLRGDRDGRVRSAAATAAGKPDHEALAPELLAALARLIEDDDRDVRFAALIAVGNLGGAPMSETPAMLVQRLYNPSDRHAASYAVGKLGSAAVSRHLVPALSTLPVQIIYDILLHWPDVRAFTPGSGPDEPDGRAGWRLIPVTQLGEMTATHQRVSFLSRYLFQKPGFLRRLELTHH
jgi:hypothetical protein